MRSILLNEAMIGVIPEGLRSSGPSAGAGIRGGGIRRRPALAQPGTIRPPEKEWTKSRDAKSLGSEVDGDG